MITIKKILLVVLLVGLNCGFAATPPPEIARICKDNTKLSYENGTLTMYPKDHSTLVLSIGGVLSGLALLGWIVGSVHDQNIDDQMKKHAETTEGTVPESAAVSSLPEDSLKFSDGFYTACTLAGIAGVILLIIGVMIKNKNPSPVCIFTPEGITIDGSKILWTELKDVYAKYDIGFGVYSRYNDGTHKEKEAFIVLEKLRNSGFSYNQAVSIPVSQLPIKAGDFVTLLHEYSQNQGYVHNNGDTVQINQTTFEWLRRTVRDIEKGQAQQAKS